MSNRRLGNAYDNEFKLKSINIDLTLFQFSFNNKRIQNEGKLSGAEADSSLVHCFPSKSLSMQKDGKQKCNRMK